MKPRKCNSYKDDFVIYKAYLRKNEEWELINVSSLLNKLVILVKDSKTSIITPATHYNAMCILHNKRLLKAKTKNVDILDKIERKYLSNIISPFRNRIKALVKTITYMNNDEELISIIYDSNSVITLPSFKKDTMYKNMELNMLYTLKTLKL